MNTGLDRNKYRPLDPKGNRFRGQLGCHVGRYAHWNIRHPQPGFSYYWANRTEADVRNLVNQGYTVVRPDDPEYQTDLAAENLSAANLAQGHAHQGGNVLMRIPEELQRAKHQRQIERNRHFVDGATQEFLRGYTSIPEKYLAKAVRYIVPNEHKPFHFD